MNPTTNTEFNKYADLIVGCSRSLVDSTAERAKNCVSSLTSEERDYLLKVLTNTVSSQNQIIEDRILEKISKIEDSEIKHKDADKSLLRQTCSNISRFVKNTFGERKSTNETLARLQSINRMKSIKGQEDLLNRFFSPAALPEEMENRLKSHGNKELDCKNEYELFGLKPGAPLKEVDRAFIDYLTKHNNDSDKDKVKSDYLIGERSYQRILLLMEAKKVFKDLTPLTLANANKESISLGLKDNPRHINALNSLTILAGEDTDFPGLVELIKNKLYAMNRPGY